MTLVKVCDVQEMIEGKGKQVSVNGKDIGLFLSDGQYYAMENTCPHREGYLHEGEVKGTTVTCPWHFAVFDLTTGSPLEGPATRKRATYEVVIEGDQILIHVPD